MGNGCIASSISSIPVRGFREQDREWVDAKLSPGEPCAELPHDREQLPASALSEPHWLPRQPCRSSRPPAPEKERFAFMKI